MFNFDIILGNAAKQLDIQNSDLVKNLAITNTVIGSLTIMAYTSYNWNAAQDLRLE